MSMPRILLIGAGGHARACIDVIESTGAFVIAGLIGQDDELGTELLGYPVLGNDAALPELARSVGNALITVGQIESPSIRMRMARQLERLGIAMPVIVAASAHVSPHAAVGEGTIVMHGATINAGARVGAYCIINSHALVEHDARTGDFCHVSTGAMINGNAVVGEGSFLGSGSVLRNGIKVGQRCVIGMGLAVLHDQPDDTIYLGKS